MDEKRLATIAMEFGILIFSLCLHEFGHAWMAERKGDPTPRMLGRLTMDPRAHMDPVGTVLFPLLCLFFPGLMLFGWAKPVPITPENFLHPRRDGAWVAFAGPLANGVLCVASMASLALLDGAGFFGMSAGDQLVVIVIFKSFFWVNFALGILNLIPLYPLDGSWILKAFLPPKWSYHYSRFDRYGALVLLAGFYLGLLNVVFNPLAGGLYDVLEMTGMGRLARIIYL